ncbi:MAG TPA: hypothetical protein VJT14_13415 [Candidatus Dormibacteraeota bacterium]|nr:hypothetical protein [Candidatus Dormibacteraeota bacterium]
MDQGTRDRRPKWRPGKVERHRHGEGPAVPGGIGATLPHRKQGDVGGAVGEPQERHGDGRHEDIACQREDAHADPARQGRDTEHGAFSPLAAVASEKEDGDSRSQPEQCPQLADQRGVTVHPLKDHDGQRHDQDAKTHIDQ